MKLNVAILLAAGLSACRAALPEPSRDVLLGISSADIQAHVDFLASDELAGRYARSEEALVAAKYIADQFEAAGLEPFGDDATWFQAIGVGFAPNVVALVRGESPHAVVITAHYDHLKPKQMGEDRIFNGADDNASGTAALLEVAQAIAGLEDRPPRTVVFVAFSAEEGGLLGAHYFVENAPIALSEIVGNINMDMVSRGEERLIFCEPGPGSEHLIAAMERWKGSVGLDVRVGVHPEWLTQSDHYAFIKRDVPAVYFGVEDHVDYHRVSDHADKILPALTERVARLVFLMATSL